MTRSLLEMYLMGAITGHHLAVESLLRVDTVTPGAVLSNLPTNVLLEALRFANEYQSGRMLSNYGDTPSPEQVLAARLWIENSLQQKAHATVSG